MRNRLKQKLKNISRKKGIIFYKFHTSIQTWKTQVDHSFKDGYIHNEGNLYKAITYKKIMVSSIGFLTKLNWNSDIAINLV